MKINSIIRFAEITKNLHPKATEAILSKDSSVGVTVRENSDFFHLMDELKELGVTYTVEKETNIIDDYGSYIQVKLSLSYE